MRRREFISLLGGAPAAWPLAAPRAAPPPERELDAFLRALADRGYVQGRNFVLVPQWGDGNVARLPELAVALVNAAVDIIVAEGTIVARAAAAVTTTVPIVMVGAADPFAGGLVKSPVASRRKCDRVLQPGHRYCQQGFRDSQRDGSGTQADRCPGDAHNLDSVRPDTGSGRKSSRRRA